MKRKPLKIQQNNCIITSPVGKLGIVVVDDKLVEIKFLSSTVQLSVGKGFIEREVFSQIKQYFHNPKLRFKLPIKLVGTLLQQKIWRAIQKIPCGKTITYSELAHRLNTSPRVIGNACRRNPIPIIIPCHRVVAVAGLGGYCGSISGSAIKNKKWLLQHENQNS